ncbi:hypothetical protein [Mucilaginibacter sp. HD30]
MKTRFLFPYTFKKTGTLLFLTGLALSVASTYFEPEITTYFVSQNNRGNSIPLETILNDAKLITLIVSLILISFSKEQIEDEQIAQLRLDSLQWAIYFNYILMLICVLAFNGFDFLAVITYNILSPLAFFIIRFRWAVYQLNKLGQEGELS